MTGPRANGRRNGATALVLLGVAVGMGGLAYASVPLYRLFCQVTGFGGTTQVADAAPGRVLNRKVTIRFNADVNSALAWRFQPAQNSVEVRLGERTLAFYEAVNLGAGTLSGSATFNVTPVKAGRYFQKIDCFCFTEQTLKAGQMAKMPVSFFVDPKMAEDRNLDDITAITLSYTFFKTETPPDETRAADSRAVPNGPARALN